MQHIRVYREGRFAALILGDRDLILLGEVEQRLAALKLPFAPRRDHLDVGLQRIITKLETDLVVALASGAVTDSVGADLTSNLDLALGDKWPSDRCAE